MMKNMRLTTYWTADEARIVYEFLMDMQALIWDTYGEDMAQWYEAECRADNQAGYDEDVDFDDDIVF